ncbi:MAG TPA: hypothetical protein VLU25_08255 [Acidobacteriota bacterium]|nr:hypothetical protein [Acidobacteriota bacterium]
MPENLSKKKIEAEIAFIELQRSEIRRRLLLDYFKALALTGGAVIAFVLIQRPIAEIQARQAEESMLNNRAKLILDWVGDSDAESRQRKLVALETVYGRQQWTEDLQRLDSIRKYADELNFLRKEIDRLELEMSREAMGTGPGGRPGRGPVYAYLERLKSEYELTASRLARLSQDPSTAK